MKNVGKGTAHVLRVYAVTITICFALVLAAFLIVFFHAGYDDKILAKLGIVEEIRETNWAVVGWNNTINKLDYDADIVFFGDSIICESDFGKDFTEYKIVNMGYPGDSTTGMLERVGALAAVKPEKVFLMGGINGLKDDNVDACVDKYKTLLDAVVEAVPGVKLYICSVLPVSNDCEKSVCHNSTIIKFNSYLKNIVADRGFVYIDLHSLYVKDGELNPELTKDGVHLRPKAYEYWTDAIAEYVLE